MGKIKDLRIGDVVAQTGLTERAVRHYEKLGLFRTVRTAAGQRLYGEDVLRALAVVRVLKRAGFSLAEIRTLLKSEMPAQTLVSAQIESMRHAAAEIQKSLKLLQAIQRELSEQGSVDPGVFGRLADICDRFEPDQGWREVFDRYFSPSRQAEWVTLQERLSDAVDVKTYDRAWHELADDIRAALPLSPASAKAQRLLARWDKLMEPFNRISTAKQKEEARNFWSSVSEWGDRVKQPMTPDVIEFVKAARAAQANKGTKKK